MVRSRKLAGIYSVNNTVYPAPPAFTSYTPARYLRPFGLFPRHR